MSLFFIQFVRVLHRYHGGQGLNPNKPEFFRLSFCNCIIYTFSCNDPTLHFGNVFVHNFTIIQDMYIATFLIIVHKIFKNKKVNTSIVECSPDSWAITDGWGQGISPSHHEHNPGRPKIPENTGHWSQVQVTAPLIIYRFSQG